jgi:hypothetical protein
LNRTYRTTLHVLALAGGFVLAAQAATAPGPDDAAGFIATRGPNQFDYTHPDIKEAFPFGRSDAANDKKLADSHAFGALTDFGALDHRHYIVEGDRFAVEWLYHATWKRTGNKQVEASLCFGRVKDQQLISWTEYFDDTVGELQDQHLLPLYAESEVNYPWPSPTALSRVYRP